MQMLDWKGHIAKDGHVETQASSVTKGKMVLALGLEISRTLKGLEIIQMKEQTFKSYRIL